MSIIEMEMNCAVAWKKNWRSGNTQVSFLHSVNVSVVYLFDNKIAEVYNDSLRIFDGGWKTKTTKSRLNALIYNFCNERPDYRPPYEPAVFQKNYEWFITNNNQQVSFTNGFTFALGRRNDYYLYKQEKTITVLMGLHPRLGENSHLMLLDSDLMRYLCFNFGIIYYDTLAGTNLKWV